MSAGIPKMKVLSMYKSLLRESEKFTNYNFRSYALRRIRDSFKENKTLNDPKAVKQQFQFAQDNLAIIKRQVVIGDMYKTENLVIENMR